MIPGLPQLGVTELMIILTIVLLLFGAKGIPKLARAQVPGSSARASPGTMRRTLEIGNKSRHWKGRFGPKTYLG